MELSMSKNKKSYLLTTFLLVVTFLYASVYAQQNKHLTPQEKKSYIEKTSKLLIDNYVFPEVAVKIENHLKALLAKGAFDNISDIQEFAGKMTFEMQSISQDKHMRCRLNSANAKIQRRPLPDFSFNGLKEETNFNFARAGKLDGQVGYLEIFNFPTMQRAKNSADDAMKLIADSKALIIDLRRNGGGNPDLIQYICSYFFDKPTHINSIYWRSTNKTNDFITFEKVDGKKMSNIPIIVLTSSYTFSGGEEFAYNIQTQKRGVLIGETTGGGANPGGSFPISDELEVFIPTGRAINPITKTNWEGVGVIPDIKIEASKAFDIAYPKAIEAAKKM